MLAVHSARLPRFASLRVILATAYERSIRAPRSWRLGHLKFF